MNNYPYGNDPMRDMDSTIPAAPFNPGAAQQSPSAPQQIMPPPPVPQPAAPAPQPVMPPPQPVMPPPQPVMPPPQPVMQQPVVQQPYTPAYSAPVSPSSAKKGFLKENILGIIVSACGISSVALGIGGIIESNNSFAFAMANTAKTYKSSNNLVDGPAPALGLVMVILGLLFGAAAVVLGFLFSKKQTEEGSPKSIAFKLGIVLGAVGVLLFMFAIFATSCSTCSYCSIDSATSKR